MDKLLLTFISSIVSGLAGYLLSFIINKIKNARNSTNEIIEEFKHIKESQLIDMKNDLSNKFFVYDSLEEVEDYLVMGWQEKAERYFESGGDSWVHQLYEKSKSWKIKKTNYTSN